MVTYRLRTSTGRLIFLRSRGFIQYDDNTKEISSFFCINSLIEYITFPPFFLIHPYIICKHLLVRSKA